MTKIELIKMLDDWTNENEKEMEQAATNEDWEYYHGRIDFAMDFKPFLEKIN